LIAALNAGYRSLGPVIGASTFQLNSAAYRCGVFLNTGGHYVLESYERSLDALWEASVQRIEDEARRLGAHGVIGITLREEAISAGVHQLQLVGTAVSATAFGDGLATPFLSFLGLDDLIRLLQAGWTPAGIGWGVAAIHIHSWSNNAWWQGATFTNAEMDGPTKAVQAARHRCQDAVRRRLATQPGHVLVGSDLHLERRPQKCGNQEGGSLVRARMTGTAVVRYGAATAPTLPVLRLQERRP
jgi:hypothetical protein